MTKTKWTPEAIRNLRRRYRETQTEFGNRILVSQDAVTYWETGKGAPPGPVRLLLDRLEEDLNSDAIRPRPDEVVPKRKRR